MFKYVLQDDAIPKLIGIDVCLKVRAFVCDGDPHLIAMITQAITTKPLCQCKNNSMRMASCA
jgi:hypothetical protein